MAHIDQPSPHLTLLQGVTVIEQPYSVAIRYAGRLLALLGARVLQAGAPDATGVGYGGAASTAYAAWLDSGKQACADLPAALAAAAGVQLLIAGPAAAQVQAADAALRAASAAPLRLGLTWFATDGPYRDWAGSDAVIQAMSGVAFATGPVDADPMLPRGHAPQIVAGVTAVIAALGALLGRQRGWAGRSIDVDVLSANLCFSESATCSAAPSGDVALRRGVNRFTPTYPGGIYRTQDGWIGITALTPPQWAAFCDLIDQPALGREPRYQVALQRLEQADALDPVLRPAMLQRRSADWLQLGQGRRIPFAPVPDLAELPLTPHWVERGSFAPVPGVAGAVGPTLPFQVETVAARALNPANATRPVAGNLADGQMADSPLADGPLAGLRVLDLSMGWAGPLATRNLADLGADVIKVESCSHVDWWRGFDAPDLSDPPPYELRPAFLMINRHKRGITLDLKSADGVALLKRLAATSDVMVENYAPGVLDKLGVGTRQLAGEVPGLVALAMGAFGNRGPWRGFRAYGSTVEQASGLPFVNGQPDDPPTMQHVAYGDPVAGLYGALAVLAGLYRRGQSAGSAESTLIDLGQVECLFQLGADALVAQSTQDERLARQGSRQPLSMLRITLPCAAAAVAVAVKDRWIALSVETAAQWQALTHLIGGAWAAGHDLAACKAQEPALEAAVRAWAAPLAAADAVARLQQAGIPAGPVRPGSHLMADPQCAALGSFQWLDRAFVGRHLSSRSAFRLDGQAPPLGGSAPTLGQANAEVLGGLLGLSDPELQSLARAGVIGQRAVWPA